MQEIRAGSPRPRLVLWRHGQTEWNVLEKAQGHADIPLDATGRRQARRAAKLLAT
jgi:probable phosphoglycerate mutase